MWLIDTSSLQLKEFQTCPVGQYAILSHRWQQDELTFEEFRAQSLSHLVSQPAGRQQRGLQKVRRFCLQARTRGLRYPWADTCCIDKRSSAELTEAINSMFNWYANAKECYIYLADVESDRPGPVMREEPDVATLTNLTDLLRKSTAAQTQNDEPNLPQVPLEGRKYHGFPASAWFQRGWTLQELIAPSHALFFNAHWNYLGDKLVLAARVAKITGIDVDLLLAKRKLLEYSVAQRMSGAANRVTTRPEDIAYCLLGIFDVNIPLLYGEGQNAFLRLQQAIIQSSDDESIFAWSSIDPTYSGGLLASGPQAFSNASHVEQIQSQSGESAYSLTNKGLAIERHLVPVEVNTYLMPLQCRLSCAKSPKYGHDTVLLGIYLCRTNVDNLYRRVCYESHPMGFDTRLLNKRRGEAMEPGHSESLGILMYDHSCPFICEEVLVQQSNSVRLYIPQSYRGPLPPRGPLRIQLSKEAIAGKPPFNASYHSEGPTSESDAFIGTNARIESYEGGSTLTIYGSEMNEGIDIDLFGYGIDVKQLTLGFDFEFRPICLVSFQTPHQSVSGLRKTMPGKPFYEIEWHKAEQVAWAMRNGIRIICGDRLEGIQQPIEMLGGHTTITIVLIPSASHPSQWEFSITATPLPRTTSIHSQTSSGKRGGLQTRLDMLKKLTV